MISPDARAMILDSTRAGVPLDGRGGSARAAGTTVADVHAAMADPSEEGRAFAREMAAASEEGARASVRNASADEILRPSPPAPEPEPVVPVAAGPAIAADKLAQLRALVHRLPLAQQDKVIQGSPLDRLRMDAIANALARHPEAARAVAAALRGIQT